MECTLNHIFWSIIRQNLPMNRLVKEYIPRVNHCIVVRVLGYRSGGSGSIPQHKKK
jgi:hypothetical protein